MKVFERENISVTRPTLENISVTQQTLENVSVTWPYLEKISATQPTFPVSPSKNEFTISPLKKWKRAFHDVGSWATDTTNWIFQWKMEKGTYQMTQIQAHHFQTRYQRKINVIRRKSVVNTGNMTCQTHHRATIIIRPKTVITDASYTGGTLIGKRIRSNYAHV